MKLIADMIYGKSKEEDKKSKKNPLSSQQQSDMDNKIEDELFETVLRVATVSTTQTKADTLAQDIARSMIQYTYTGLNSFEYIKVTGDALA